MKSPITKPIFRLLLTMMTSAIGNYAIAQIRPQTPYPKVGDTLTDHVFTDLVNYPSKSVALNDFRGKWLILDFWGFSCSGCIASWPKMDKLHKQFKDQVHFLLVGATKARTNTSVEKIMKISKELFHRKKEKLNLTIPTAFDSVLYLKHDVGALPQIFIIDPSGVIRAKTEEVNEEQIRQVLKGNIPHFVRSYSYSEVPARTKYNEELPLLTSGHQRNGGIDTTFLFRSILKSYTDTIIMRGVPNLFKKGNKMVETGKLEAFGARLYSLYKVAFFGIDSWDDHDPEYFRYSPDFKFNTKDSALFARNSTYSYAYSLTVPKSKSTPEYLMKVMRNDLENYFGYKARVVKQQMPVYYLEVANLSKLLQFKANINSKKMILSNGLGDLDNCKARNFPIYDFVMVIMKDIKMKIQILNRTNLVLNVDMDFKADMTNVEDIKAKLTNYGLKIVEGWKEMEVIEINDAVQ